MKVSQPNKTLITIPAYDEGSRILEVIKRCNNYLDDNVDLIVINDGSNDNTLEICENAGVNVISIPFNMGVGNALKTGFKYAIDNNYEYVITLDADGQHNPEDIPKFIEKLSSGNCDIVIGSRFLNGDEYDGSKSRIFGIKLFARLISFLVKEKITDVTSGYRGMNRKVLFFTIIDAFNFDYPDADFLLTLHRAGYRFEEIPVSMNRRISGTSQHGGLKPLYYLFKMFLSIFIILLRKKNKGEHKT